jgi:hypothetical protein
MSSTPHHHVIILSRMTIAPRSIEPMSTAVAADRRMVKRCASLQDADYNDHLHYRVADERYQRACRPEPSVSPASTM